MKRTVIGLALAATLCASRAFATTITFDADSPGPKPDGFSSVDSPLVTFTDTLGGVLFVASTSPDTPGRQLIDFNHDPTALRMDFASPVTSLQFSFSNNDACCLSPGDSGFLAVFNGLTFVGTTSTAMDTADGTNQTIAFTGGPFTSALFWYGASTTRVLPFTPIIDDVTFTVGDAALPDPDPVPEPATLALVGLGLGVLARAARRA